jgi:DnaJ domain
MAFLVMVVLVGLCGGYWLVSKLFPGSSSSATPPGAASTGTPAPSGGWHDVLQVAPTASADEIRAAYRQLISQYHPDKVETLGPDIRDLARRKSQEITVAYESGLKARGKPA